MKNMNSTTAITITTIPSRSSINSSKRERCRAKGKSSHLTVLITFQSSQKCNEQPSLRCLQMKMEMEILNRYNRQRRVSGEGVGWEGGKGGRAGARV